MRSRKPTGPRWESLSDLRGRSAQLSPEDYGGPWGYQHLLEVLADPAHPEYDEQIEWLGEEFDPNEFLVEYAGVTLGARFNRK